MGPKSFMSSPYRGLADMSHLFCFSVAYFGSFLQQGKKMERVCVCVCVCVRVQVCVGESERKRERVCSVLVTVCVCERVSNVGEQEINCVQSVRKRESE